MRMLLLIALVLVRPAAAQDAPEVINRDNVERLQPVAQIDFADLDAEFNMGWFAVDAQGERYAVTDVAGRVYVLDSAGTVLDSVRPLEDDLSYPGSLVDAAFAPDGTLYTLHSIDGQTYVNSKPVALETPIALWATDEPQQVFVETSTLGEDEASIVELQVTEDGVQIVNVAPYAPGEDEAAVVRIGRIPPPYAVTSSLEGIVKLWNLQTGEVLHDAENGTEEPSVFGAVNSPPTHLVWRDNASASLYLLDFATGENRTIADLGGAYAQWFFLSQDASVIFALNLDFEPLLVAWDAQTGRRFSLGEHRTCSRPQPDMARMSDDGTTLVVGCDTGLEIWRMVNE